MKAQLCSKPGGGSVQIHNDDFLKEIETDTNEHSTSTQMNKSDGKTKKTKPKASSPEAGMDSQSLIGQTMKVQDWLNDKTIKGLQGSGSGNGDGEKSDVESREARKLYNPLLQTENTFVKDIENFLDTKDMKELRKKEMLHKKWNDRVYEPLRKNIIEVMDSEDWPELDRRKRELHKQYLEFVNQKGHVFLDTMDPEEYYAQALNGHRPAPIKHTCLKWDKRILAAKKHFDHQYYKVNYDPAPEELLVDQIATKALRDPLLSQGRQRSAEERTILRCITGYDYTDKDIEQVKLPPLPLVPLGRHGTDSLQWLRMPLHNIESTPRMASRRRMRGTFNKSHLDQETWERTPIDTSQVDREMQIQKKRMFMEMPPFRKPPRSRIVRSQSAGPSVHSVAVQTMEVPETLAVNAVNTETSPVSIET